MAEDTGRLVMVLTTSSPALLAIVKSVLQEAKIQYVTPGVGFQELYGAGDVKIQVQQEDAEEARKRLGDLRIEPFGDAG